MTKILFIGSFLSKKRGTKGISEKLAEDLPREEFELVLVSYKENQVLRMLDIIRAVTFYSYDMVHIDVFSGAGFRIAEIASSIAKWRNKKILLTLHGGRLPEFYQKNSKRVVSLFNRATKIYTPSLYLQDYFRKELVFSIQYLPNSFNTQTFPERQQVIENHSILWVRAHNVIYQPWVAVEALKIIRETFPQASLTMIGPDKGRLSKVKEIIAQYQLQDAVRILGAVPNNELSPYYTSHHVFFNTTTFESFGVCVLEAAASGIPIVSNQVGEIPYLWKDENEALLVSNNSPQLFAEQTIRIFNDKDLAMKLSNNARKKAEQFDWEEVKKEWEKALKV
ncbi:MAG: glycosyltransferase family 4 protein [Crocinitomicaceae bacterium]|nr:glycosyltransferase family 4 protein [Crocinitomicaceae bacterium]